MAARFFVFCITCFVVPLCVSSVPPGRYRSSTKGIIRSRREACVDGTYDFGGLTCCLCAAGQQVVEHCSSNLKYGKCQICEDGTYSSYPSSQKTCQPCASCAQPNANLEEEEPCTRVNNTKCRCKKDHFCSSKECTICHPCKTCGIGGIKKDCTPTSDRICNDDTGAVAGIVFAVILLVGIIAGVIYWIRGHHVFPCRKKKMGEGGNPRGSHEDLELIPANIEPLLPEIANELGWNDMKNIARRTGVTEVSIEACVIDHQNNAEERTLQLLMKWAEKEGKNAPGKLIQTLKKMNKRGKAEKVIAILRATE